MQRKRPSTISDDRIRWRKKGGGTHYHWDGQVVHTGEILLATEFEVQPFHNLFEAMESLPSENKTPSVGLHIQYKGGGKYNVVNENTGNPVNDRLLTKEEAEGLADG